MEKFDQPNPPQPQKQSSGGCLPTIILFVGLGMLAVGLLAVLNTAFGWELVLEVYGSGTPVPDNWESTIAVLVIGVVLALVGWLTGTERFLNFYRKNKLVVILVSIAIPVGIFFALNEYDKTLKRRNAKYIAQRDSMEAANPQNDYEEEVYNPYEGREIKFVITNPKLDTMQVYLDGEQVAEVKPYEFKEGKLGPGTHRLAAVVKGDTVESVDLDIAERTKETLGEIVFVNVDSFFNIGVLNFQDYYDADNRKRKGAKTINYRMESLHWGEHIFSINVPRATLVLPRQISLDFSAGNALKLVVLPDEWKDNKDRAFDYVIWKFIDEEKKGYMQDGVDFFMLSADKKKKAIKNRLSDDVKRFKKSEQ